MVVLFDFDGVIADTESQYTVFWSARGEEYLGLKDFGLTIKGQTLKQIVGKYFADRDEDLARLLPQLDTFEQNMSYDYIPGAFDFIKKLKKADIRTAIVTSSNNDKMAIAFRNHPELPGLMDAIITSEAFSRSKPDPECFLKGMEMLGSTPEDTVIFEDSFHGLNAGRASGAKVIGLATTNTREAISQFCDRVIDDFTQIKVSDL